MYASTLKCTTIYTVSYMIWIWSLVFSKLYTLEDIDVYLHTQSAEYQTPNLDQVENSITSELHFFFKGQCSFFNGYFCHIKSKRQFFLPLNLSHLVEGGLIFISANALWSLH